MASEDRAERPLMTLDFDGVICAPILNLNVGIHRGFLDPAAEPRPAVLWPRWMARPWDLLRYELRRPLPEARSALAKLAEVRRLTVLTGRRSAPHRWLRRYGMHGLVDDVVINDGVQRSPHYKLEILRTLGVTEHVEDDPRTAQLLAEHGMRVYLRDWPRNRGLDYHHGVVRIRDIMELAERLQADRAE